jgi:hypothetical protein
LIAIVGHVYNRFITKQILSRFGNEDYSSC